MGVTHKELITHIWETATKKFEKATPLKKIKQIIGNNILSFHDQHSLCNFLYKQLKGIQLLIYLDVIYFLDQSIFSP